MPTLVTTNFNIVTAFLGGFISLFGLVSYLLKERFYLSEALISLLVGVAFSHGANWLRPYEYALNSEENIDLITLYFSRLVLGVQLVLAGVQLPHRYLRTEWRSLAVLLGPGMTIMWLSASLLVWAMVPHLPFLHALAIGACVTPTDPVLSNSIVKGKFADKNIPKELQRIIIAESGANDGLGYPFLFLALYIIRYNGRDGIEPVGHGIGLWFGEMWGYTIILSVLYGALVGWIAKELLHFAEEKKFVDRESFLVFAISLALFITGTCGMIGSDDVLACFVAGNAFTWDDWFRQETEDDSLQPTIDLLLNIVVFMWRLPMILTFHRYLKEIDGWRQAVIVGFFGPIGVSAVFYLYVSIDFLNQVLVDGQVREDAARLQEVMRVVIWFLATTSIVVHGLSIPLGKLGYHAPRQLTTALSTERSTGRSTERNEPGSVDMRRLQDPASYSRRRTKQNQDRSQPPTPSTFMLGQRSQNALDEPSRPVRIINSPMGGSGAQTPRTPDDIEANADGHPEHLGHLKSVDRDENEKQEHTQRQNGGHVHFGANQREHPSGTIQKDE
ncbi:MAG: hypothetical protein Q9198_006538 [Flavoplaca austrocitrina]